MDGNKYTRLEEKDLHEQFLKSLTDRSAVIVIAEHEPGEKHLIDMLMNSVMPEFPHIAFYRVTTSLQHAFTKKYSVTRLPATFFVDEGKIVDMHPGIISKKKLTEKLITLFLKD